MSKRSIADGHFFGARKPNLQAHLPTHFGSLKVSEADVVGFSPQSEQTWMIELSLDKRLNKALILLDNCATMGHGQSV